MRTPRTASNRRPAPSPRSPQASAADDESLGRLFRAVVVACAGGSLALGSVGCGGTTTTTKSDASAAADAGRDATAAPDAGLDAATPDGSLGGDGNVCQPVGCGGCGAQCGPGCLATEDCVNGATVYGCNCDAGLDAGLSCNPDRTTNFYIPLSCFDATPTVNSPTDCPALCGVPNIPSCSIVEASGGTQVLGCYLYLAAGRRPSGFRPGRGKRGGAVGDYFAGVTELESASITAFRSLRDELVAHGAPEALVRGAEVAAQDEVRHTRMMGALAHRHGARPSKPRSRVRGTRALEAIALENAVEGCVREAYGALAATWQASAARDPRVRSVMRAIAADETRHAALALAVARWADASLDDAARARVAAARDAAVAELAAALDAEPSAELRAEAGLPDAARAKALFAGIKQALWAA